MKVVCSRCGGSRETIQAVCPSCGHAAQGEGLLVAWLLSAENLTEEQLEAVAERIKGGQPLRPSPAQLQKARAALGLAFSSDPGLTIQERLYLLAGSLFLTPLPGWVAWWSWRESRPRASWQALALTAPATVLFTVLLPAIAFLRM
ncbi:MAG: hypothetical protein GWP91_13470 [Rhodobacterales bacterium]|nr:hypothetical protein [Rhodobacterales bacterium]